MTASLLYGKPIASMKQKAIKQAVLSRQQGGQRPPGLAVILIGADPASQIYVANKRKACSDVGFYSKAYDLPQHTSEAKLLALIDQLNNDNEIDGILVQLPLPNHIHATNVIERIKPTKDVDGFHPYNLGRLAQGHPQLRPCTPYGIMQMLNHYELSVFGKQAVVVGASNIVGRPMALELLIAKATVTICHSATAHLEHHIRSAELIITATGIPDIIDSDWLHERHILVDVGIHRQPNGKLRGDIQFALAKEQVAWITPVPGGVGPMTISTLLQNTLLAATLGPVDN